MCPTESTECCNQNSDSTERLKVWTLTQLSKFHSRNKLIHLQCQTEFTTLPVKIRHNWTFGCLNCLNKEWHLNVSHKKQRITIHVQLSPRKSQVEINAWHASEDCHHVKLQNTTPNAMPLNHLGHWHQLACRSNQNMSCSPVPQKMEQLSASHS